MKTNLSDMENTDIEKKIKDLKKFIKQKTDQGTANYLGKEIREICGMVETEQSSITAVVQAKPEKFACYEIHTVQARMYGCATQCEECKAEEQALSSFKPKDKDASA
jgi:hypothetical protein